VFAPITADFHANKAFVCTNHSSRSCTGRTVSGPITGLLLGHRRTAPPLAWVGMAAGHPDFRRFAMAKTWALAV
jgi:hypothetical protein